MERYAPETVLLYAFAIAGVFWMLVTPSRRIAAAGYPLSLWGVFVLLGLSSMLVPFELFDVGLRRLPASETSVIATAEPLVAMLAAGLLLHERLRAFQFLGAALVLIAALLASRGRPQATEAAVERG